MYYSKKRKKWIAQIMFKQKCYNLGGYDTLEEAAKVRKRQRRNCLGIFWNGMKQNRMYEMDKFKKDKQVFFKLTPA